MMKNWWLLALCGVLDAAISLIYVMMLDADGPLTFHAWRGAVVLLGELAIAAGACTVAAGIWGRSWPLLINGLACGTLGLILAFWTGPLAFRTLALPIVVMAIGIGIHELVTARMLRRHRADKWFLGAAGVVSVGFALAFLAFVFRWIELDPRSPAQTLLWQGAYFGFSAICMLGLGLQRTRVGR